MINRIRSLSSATQRNKISEQPNSTPNDVFVNQDISKDSKRSSVIKPTTFLQEQYNVPVQNKFSHFLN
jgi:hypothetical protein